MPRSAGYHRSNAVDELGRSRMVLTGHRSTYLGLIAVTAIWGLQFALGKLMVSGVPPFTVAFARSALACVLYAVLVARQPGGFFIPRRDWPIFVFLIVVGNPVYHGTFFLALSFAPASDGALLLPTMNPVFTVLVAWVLGHETPTRRQLAGMVVSGIGVVVVFVAVSVSTAAALGPNRLLGDLLFLTGSLSWGVYSAVGRPYFARYGAARMSGLTALFGLLPMFALSTFGGDTLALTRLSASDSLILLFMAIFGAFLGFVVFNRAIDRVGAGAASRFTNLVPLWGLAFAVPLLGERPSAFELLGGAIIVAGVWVSTTGGGPRSPLRRRAASPPRPAGD